MDPIIEILIEPVKTLLKEHPSIYYLVAAVAVLLVVGPRLTELRHFWLELRLGRERLEHEKLRLEVLKLRIDLRQLAQQLQLPDIARELEEVTVSPPSVVIPSPPPPEPTGVLWRLLAGHPRLGGFVMLIAQTFLGFFLGTFAIATVALPFVGWSDPEIGPWSSVVLAIIYAGFAWLSWKGFIVTRSIRRKLAAR
jgi:hypothetical protein